MGGAVCDGSSTRGDGVNGGSVDRAGGIWDGAGDNGAAWRIGAVGGRWGGCWGADHIAAGRSSGSGVWSGGGGALRCG